MDKTNNSLSGEIIQSDGLTLYLKWDTRDLIINSLNQFSALLMGKHVSSEQKSKIKSDNNNLILVLSNLPLRSNDDACKEDEDEDEEIPRKKIKLENNVNADHHESSGSKRNSHSEELFLELHPDTRLRIIKYLINNQSFSISFAHTISIEKKKCLVKENKTLINELLDLNIATNGPVDYDSDLNFDSTDSPVGVVSGMTNGSNRKMISRHEIDDLSVNLKTEISELRASINTEINEFTGRFEQFKSEITKKVAENSIDREAVDFTFVLENVENFLVSSTPRFSEIFYCRSIPWCLSVQVMEKNDMYRTKYLGFYLRCENTSDYTKWKCVTDAELKLLSQLPDIQNNFFRQQYNVAKVIKTTFQRVPPPPATLPNAPGQPGSPFQSTPNLPNLSVFSSGFNDFIAIDKLRDLKNGFIKNNTMLLQCSLKAEKVIRNA